MKEWMKNHRPVCIIAGIVIILCIVAGLTFGCRAKTENNSASETDSRTTGLASDDTAPSSDEEEANEAAADSEDGTSSGRSFRDKNTNSGNSGSPESGTDSRSDEKTVDPTDDGSAGSGTPTSKERTEGDYTISEGTVEGASAYTSKELKNIKNADAYVNVGSSGTTFYVMVLDAEGKKTVYTVSTSAATIKGALDDMTSGGFSYSGDTTIFGTTITEVNGSRAKYSENGAYWGLYLNGLNCPSTINKQAVSAGAVFTLAYEKGES